MDESIKRILLLPDGTVENDTLENLVAAGKWSGSMQTHSVGLNNIWQTQQRIRLEEKEKTRNYVRFYLFIDDFMQFRQMEYNSIATDLVHKWDDTHRAHNLQIYGPALLEVRFDSALKGTTKPHCTYCELNLEKEHVDLLLYSDSTATEIAHALSYKQCPRHSF